MELNLLSLLCLIGFAPVALSIKLTAPLLVMEQVTWPVAQNYCRENYIDLFTITNADDQAKLIEEMNKKSVIGPAWIGLYIELDNWYWSSYNHLPLKNTNLSIWHSGQPDNAYGADVCVAMYAAGYWWSYPCYYVGPFICYDANNSYADRFVAYLLPRITWLDSQAYCRQHHTDLATVMTESDVSLLGQLLPPLNIISGWVGLTRNTWEWSDRSNASYLPWLSGQPDNLNTWENCATATAGLLSDEQCTNEYYFTCSAYRVRKQIVKLQVKLTQSMLDSTVQSSILEMLKQKLQENGMLMNTTVTWRVQPDGNIFYKKVNNNNNVQPLNACSLKG
ncbi:macrophage mannose receptor 1 [Ictalurus punctatus]|uniref:Macrophage mannose receptor 1 n=1 Tax=Ictalurus punctatus TaxID=7998 RepID=A0A2D0QDP2_ICTPU|nr:macrophage mannose receptor 1 [Ictalurus punctatus]